MPDQPSAVVLNGVCASYGSRMVLRQVSHSFTTGVTAVLGVNGAGKTTLIRAMCGLIRLRSGSMTVDDRDPFASARSTREFRSRLGWMPQSPTLPGRARVVDMVRYAAWLKGADSSATISRDAAAALARVDLENENARRIHQLSGGQRRRVALACAMVGSPSLILLDEPTVGLDPLQREQFLGSVKAASAKATVIVSTHLMEDVLQAADHVVVLSGGSFIRSGSLQQILDEAGRAGDPMHALRLALSGHDTDAQAG